MKPLKTNPYRIFFQLGVLAVIIAMLLIPLFSKEYVPDFEAVCPLGGIQALSSFLLNNTLACTMTGMQIAMGLSLILAIILFSKLFCSYLCPLGSISEWLGKLGDKWKVRVTIDGAADKLLRILKYALLFITFYFTLISSELFCKWFCPYYGVVSGFDPDVNVIMASAAIAIVVVGSIFVRLFWCKYLCPLGALSNIFRFFIMFCLVLGIYLVLGMVGVQMSFMWPLAFVCALGYILELLSMKSRAFPIFKIFRNESICTDCAKCSKSCPMSIEVHKQLSVKHIDCHMCADCIQVCPEKGALTINRMGKKWLPALVLVLLVAAGFWAGSSIELPTINEYWADEETREDMEIFTISGLESMRCYGSSTAMANHLYKMDGIYGISTFVKDHKAKIWYDPEYTDTLAIQEWIFSPAYILVREPSEDVEMLGVYNLEVENFFDTSDDHYLAEILMNNDDIYGFETDFACPVKIKVYYDDRAEISSEELSKLVEQEPRSDFEKDVLRNYKVIKISANKNKVSAGEFKSWFSSE